MFANFFQTVSYPANEMFGVYNPWLVILSYFFAVFASYIALDFAGRLREETNSEFSSLLWLAGGAVAMGAGIWSMHFIGMLSFSMPTMTMHYELFFTILSLCVAIVASGFALFLLKTKVLNVYHLVLGGFILGIGIASMHYTGMEAMKIDMNIHYVPSIFALSIVIAVVASEAALWLAIKSNQVMARIRVRLKIISAAIMGLAICGMHYTGMFAAVFTPSNFPVISGDALDPTLLSVGIGVVTFVILSIAFFASTYKEGLNQQQIESARQLGMAEVSASVLHNVGNVLNSVNVSASVIAEKVTESKLDGLEILRTLINDHKNDLATFLTEDTRGMKIPEYLNKLTDYWISEQKVMSNEVSSLLKNIHHITDIISTQQGFSKITGIEHIISINELLEEALLITGLDYGNTVVEKNFAKINPMLADKVKLLQVLVNALANARDALKESSSPQKLLILKTYIINKGKVGIAITDNGTGIAPENLKKIFNYGFTTKHNGHGFGLHTCALTVNEMGGSIVITSDGNGKGATFLIELPYRLPKK